MPNYATRSVRRSAATPTALLLASVALAVPVMAAPAQAPATAPQLRWGGSLEMQGRPYFGASNFFSAGISHGATASDYRAREGNSQVVHTQGPVGGERHGTRGTSRRPRRWTRNSASRAACGR